MAWYLWILLAIILYLCGLQVYDFFKELIKAWRKDE